MHIRDYKSLSHTYRASLPSPRRKPPAYGRKEKIFLVILALALGGWGYTMLFSPLFTIANVRIDGLEIIKRAEVESILARENKNIFRFSVNHALRALNQTYFLDEARIQKIYPQSLAVNLKEKYPQFEYQTPDYFYLLDPNGLVIDQMTATSTRLKDNLTLIMEDQSKIYASRDQAIDAKKIEALVFFMEKLDVEAQIETEKIKFSRSEPEVITLQTKEGFGIIFSYTEDQATQSFKVIILLKSLGDQRKNLLYINARFVDRIYYKFK